MNNLKQPAGQPGESISSGVQISETEGSHVPAGRVSRTGATLRPHFEKVFSPEAVIEFERYINGLIVSENKTVEGINRLFRFESRNQSSPNRLLTESPFRPMWGRWLRATMCS